MAQLPLDNLLAKLVKQTAAPGAVPGGDPLTRLAATPPRHEGPTQMAVMQPPPPSGEQQGELPEELLERLCGRISNIANGAPPEAMSSSSDSDPGLDDPTNKFIPLEPENLRQARLTDSEVEALILKFLLNRGTATGHLIADQLRLPYRILEPLYRQLKQDQMVIYKNSASMNDYEYMITDMGRERGRRLFEHCTYFGSAPVSLQDYIDSVKAQTLTNQHPTVRDLERAFADLLINRRMLGRIGPAINSGRGLFLYGAAGNGKTSIAERITRAFGQTIWIPRAIGVDGEIIRMFDPMSHEPLPLKSSEGLLENRKVDGRWIRVRRPTIVVGGELTMENLEISFNSTTGISEAPLQLKSNCGTLVIDDFGRQRMRTDELLNRWIVPLEKRYDFLNLANGKKIQVPFDQLIVFSTNLQPKDLVDDAFLRRIPYKIDVVDPSEEEFRELFKLMGGKLGFDYRQEALDYLVEKHYRAVNRPFRCCQPRDLLQQIRNHCFYNDRPLEMSKENFDFAVENYFAVM